MLRKRKREEFRPKRHKNIFKRAVFIDKFVDAYRSVHRRRTFPHKEVGSMIHFLFPGGSYKGRGAYKTVHKVSSRARDLVLKTSNRKNILRDMHAYRKLPTGIRNRYFAKVYWRTKYCLLQKFGRGNSRVPPDILRKLKRIGREHGLKDVRPANIRRVDGQFKIVDASVARKP